jgi:hypothetical protein
MCSKTGEVSFPVLLSHSLCLGDKQHMGANSILGGSWPEA